MILAGRLAVLSMTAALAAAETPRIRDINVYGLRKIPRERVLRVAKLQTGDPLPGSRGDLEERVAGIPGVTAARVEAVCCEGPDIALFIGIEERGAPHAAFRSGPVGDSALPPELALAYQQFVTAARRAGGTGASPDTQGLQQQFSSFAESRRVELSQVLRTAGEPEQRAIAATVSGYAPRNQGLVDDLQYALQDPDELVRKNALESLQAVAALSVRRPALRLRIAPTWLIELLNSIVLSDRVQAADLLITLTDRSDPAVLDQLRAQALPALVEMARWDTLRYALPPFLLVGRLAGMSDSETQRRWSRGEREPVIQKAQGRAAGKR